MRREIKMKESVARALLGIPEDVGLTREVIMNGYRSAVLLTHPDSFAGKSKAVQDLAKKKNIEVNQAKTVLLGALKNGRTNPEPEPEPKETAKEEPQTKTTPEQEQATTTKTEQTQEQTKEEASPNKTEDIDGPHPRPQPKEKSVRDSFDRTEKIASYISIFIIGVVLMFVVSFLLSEVLFRPVLGVLEPGPLKGVVGLIQSFIDFVLIFNVFTGYPITRPVIAWTKREQKISSKEYKE